MKRLLLGIALVSAFFLLACQTPSYRITTPSLEKTVGDITFTLRYLPKDELKNLYGTDWNPYIDFPSKLPRRSFFVFDTTISSKINSLSIDTRSIILSLEGQNGDNKAKIKETLTIDWRPYNENSSEESGRYSIMKKTLAPRTIKVSPEKPFNGYIVFLAPAKDVKSGLISIPVKASNGDEGTVEINLDMVEAMGSDTTKDDQVGKNTGMFAP